jgi:putative PIN family toxin of toxin-antitoxin system
MIVVVDSNVIYSGLYSKEGASYKILQLIGEGDIIPALSIGLFEEYMDVLGRPPLADDFSEKDKNDFMDYFCAVSKLTEIFFLWRPFLKDPKDDMVLEAAVASGAKAIITYNTKDFVGSEQFGIRVLTPIEYLRKEKYLP